MENRNIKKGSMIKANNRSNGRFVKYVSPLLALIILLTSALAFSGCDILSEKKEMQIKEDYVSQFNITDVAPEDVVVDYYAGNWNGYEIIMLDAECHRREVWEEKIGDVTLTYYDSNRLYAWSEGGFITLTDAYASNKLSMKDLERISKKFNKDVRYYIDICDKYDFEKGRISNQYEWDGNTIYDKLDVWISREFLQDMANMSDWAPIINHLGNRVIKSVLDMKILSDCLVIFVELRINSKAFMEKASIQISEVPGVYLVGPYETEGFVYSAGGDTSGNTISDPLKDIEVEKVWDFTTGSDDVLVGIVDMGVDCSHPNLRNTVIYEMDYSVNKENFTIDIQHGTLVAGIIGSNYINDIGNIAVNKKIKIMSFLVDDEENNNQFEKMLPVYVFQDAKARYYDEEMPLKIINISLALNPNALGIEEAISNYPGLVITSAGNSGLNIDLPENYDYPSRYGDDTYSNENPRVISVGALDASGNRWYNGSLNSSGGLYIEGSNYGENTVDIYAPGVNILSTYPEYLDNGSNGAVPNGYAVKTGTSFAAPFVSGVAALLLSVDSDLTPLELKECILEGADNITIMVGDDNNIPQSAKKLNAWGAFKYLMNNYPLNYCNLVDESVTLSYSIDGDASYMKDRTVMIKLEPEHRGSFTFNISGDYPINVTLYDDELNEIETIQTKANGDKNVTFNSNIDNICHLRVDFINESHEGEISVSINPPCNGHMFDEYERYSLTHHRTFCSCGATGGLSPHVIKHADASFSTAPCILCGQLIFLDDTIVMVPGILNVCKVTLNGSYILPNGIVVLVDGDIEAYLNGTLVFYDVNNLPELQ